MNLDEAQKLTPDFNWALYFKAQGLNPDGAINIDQLGDDGQYVAAQLSRFLHVRPEEVAHWLEMGASTERGIWRRRLKEWIAKEVKPRVEHD